MGNDDIDQDLLAQQWAAALEGEGVEDTGGKSPDDKLAEEWARALATEEQGQLRKEKEQAFLSQAQEAKFKDLTEESRAPRPDSGKRELDFILDIPLDVSAELGRTRLLINELL